MSIVKLSAPGAGFTRLMDLGLGEKALAQYAGSDWLKNKAIKAAPKVIEKEIPQVVSKVHYDQILKKKI